MTPTAKMTISPDGEGINAGWGLLVTTECLQLLRPCLKMEHKYYTISIPILQPG